MTHFNFVDTVKALADAGWGQEFPTEQDAIKALGSPMDLSGACLLSIVKTIDGIMESLTARYFHDKVRSIRKEGRNVVRLFINEREPTHGPCPGIVEVDLRSQVNSWIGKKLLQGEFPSWVAWPEPPEKGTAARKAYNSWMKKKITK